MVTNCETEMSYTLRIQQGDLTIQRTAMNTRAKKRCKLEHQTIWNKKGKKQEKTEKDGKKEEKTEGKNIWKQRGRQYGTRKTLTGLIVNFLYGSLFLVVRTFTVAGLVVPGFDRNRFGTSQLFTVAGFSVSSYFSRLSVFWCSYFSR